MFRNLDDDDSGALERAEVVVLLNKLGAGLGELPPTEGFVHTC